MGNDPLILGQSASKKGSHMNDEIIDSECLAEDATKFNDYDEAIVGYTDEGCLVYDGYCILECLMKEMTREEAWDYFCYNTVRSLPYMGEHAPVIMWPGRWVDDLYDT